MDEDRLHVVFGTGQVGRTLATRLTDRGLKVRAVSQHRPVTLAEGIDWWAADASDADAPPPTRPKARRSCTSA